MEGETWDALVRRVIRAEQRELDALGDARSNASATAGRPHLVALVNPRDVPCTLNALGVPPPQAPTNQYGVYKAQDRGKSRLSLSK